MAALAKLRWDIAVFMGKIRVVIFFKTDKYYKKRYANQVLLSAKEGNSRLKEFILSGKPFVATRLGFNELCPLIKYEEMKRGFYTYNKEDFQSFCNSAGFFPNEPAKIGQYNRLMLNEMEQIDYLAVWFNAMEDFMIRKYMHPRYLSYPTALEPYYFDHPWSEALAGKKVLVISPFAASIERQYAHRDKIFQDPRILPEFELKTIKAVQTIGATEASEFEDWFAALEYMQAQVQKTDFDIALLGCGAYAMPLAIAIKKMGKQAIHIGGATQILFGIKGKRWEDGNGYIKTLFNEYWIRPSKEEKPKAADEVENGCYW